MCLGPVQSVPECKELKGVLWYGRLSARGAHTFRYALRSFGNMADTSRRQNTCRQMSRWCGATNGVCDDSAGKDSLHRKDTYDRRPRRFRAAMTPGWRSGFRRLVATSREPIPSSFLPPAGRPVSSAHWGLPPRSVSCSSPPKRRSMRKSISPKRRAAFSFEHGLL